jgi:hypothetical protein
MKLTNDCNLYSDSNSKRLNATSANDLQTQ